MNFQEKIEKIFQNRIKILRKIEKIPRKNRKKFSEKSKKNSRKNRKKFSENRK